MACDTRSRVEGWRLVGGCTRWLAASRRVRSVRKACEQARKDVPWEEERLPRSQEWQPWRTVRYGQVRSGQSS